MRRVAMVAVTVAALGVVALAAALLLGPLPPGPPGPEPGRALFHAHCATCHGADGRGGSWRARLLFLRPGDLAATETASLPDRYLADIIRDGGSSIGKPGMPSFGFALGDAEIRALVAYLRALPARAAGLRAAGRRARRRPRPAAAPPLSPRAAWPSSRPTASRQLRLAVRARPAGMDLPALPVRPLTAPGPGVTLSTPLAAFRQEAERLGHEMSAVRPRESDAVELLHRLRGPSGPCLCVLRNEAARRLPVL